MAIAICTQGLGLGLQKQIEQALRAEVTLFRARIWVLELALCVDTDGIFLD